MRRISENRKNIVKDKSENIRKKATNMLAFKKDLFYILQHYDKRIYFISESDDIKKCTKNCTMMNSLSVNKNCYVKVKQISALDLGSFNKYKIKGLEIQSIKEIKFSDDLEIEEIRIANCNIEIDVFLKILQIKNLKYLGLFDVNIYNRFDTCKFEENTNLVDSDSEEIMLRQRETEDLEEANNHYHEDIINNKIEKIFNKMSLRKFTLIQTNIKLSSIINSGLFTSLNIFRYRQNTKYLYFSFGREVYSYLKTNCIDNLNLNDIESLICQNTKIFNKEYDFKNIKHLSISNSQITNDLIYKFNKEMPKVVEFCFLDCTFSQLSFYKFLDLFGSKIRYLNLIDSLLPLDSLDYLKRSLKDCKVVFRDKRVLKYSK
jgi:hypothetical protein